MQLSDYFTIFPPNDHVLRFETRGLWTGPAIDRIGAAFMRRFTKAVNEVAATGPFILLVDLSDLPVMTPPTRELARESMIYAVAHGQYRAVEIIPKAIVLLGVTDAAEQAEQSDGRIVVRSLEEAEIVVERLQRDLRDSGVFDLVPSSTSSE
jgi:hypothetical protein